jgi:GNAT superfamily N-acetyltransferase
MATFVRPINAADRTAWEALWRGYLNFYEADIPQEQTELTWQRLLDPGFEMHGLVAELEGKVVGFAHYSCTLSSWSVEPDLFLEDLFVDSEARQRGVGKSLIFYLEETAHSSGSGKIWWETHKDNQVARKLYDSIAILSEFVKYTRVVDKQ